MSITLTWAGIDGQERLVQFDAVMSENHEDTVTVTDHPVEMTAVLGKPKATVWGEAKKRRETVRATVLSYGTPQNRPQRQRRHG